MNPTNKSQEIENFLNDVFEFDRRTQIMKEVCLPPPIGCGKPITEFRDKISLKEYTLSELCQECQDSIFGE